jgi:hypothetical protein
MLGRTYRIYSQHCVVIHDPAPISPDSIPRLGDVDTCMWRLPLAVSANNLSEGFTALIVKNTPKINETPRNVYLPYSCTTNKFLLELLKTSPIYTIWFIGKKVGCSKVVVNWDRPFFVRKRDQCITKNKLNWKTWILTVGLFMGWARFDYRLGQYWLESDLVVSTR